MLWHLKQVQICASAPLKVQVQEFRIKKKTFLITGGFPQEASAPSLFSLCSLRRAQRPASGLKVEVEDEGRPRSEVALKKGELCGWGFGFSTRRPRCER